MKKLLVLGLAVGMFLSMGMAKKPKDLPAEAAGSATPEASVLADVKEIDFKLADLNGKEVSLSSFKGKKTVMVVFSATWCGYCIKEIPELTALAKAFKGKDFEILAVDIKESQEKVAAFVNKNDINYTVLLDKDGKVSSSYAVLGIPTNLIIDKKGNIVYNANGIPPKAEEYIKKIMKE